MMYIHADNFNAYDNNLLIDVFFSVIKFIKNKNSKINLDICINKNSNITLKKDCDMFFKCGQFLMFIYAFKINKLLSEDINYNNGQFFIKLSNINFNQTILNKTSCEDIAKDIINNSTYKKDCMPNAISNIKFKNNNDFKEFEKGFILTYKTFINEKNNLVKFLENSPVTDFSLSLIKNIKILNPKDLDMQLKFIRLRYLNKIESNPLLNDLVYFKQSNDEFINLSKEFLDILTQNSIIGIHNNSMEFMFIGYINGELKPTGINNIYISIYFSYIAKVTENKYYETSALYSLIPVLHSDSSDYNTEILELMYLLNNYICFKELEEFINNNIYLFKDISKSYKKSCITNCENLILKSVQEKSLYMLKSVFIV